MKKILTKSLVLAVAIFLSVLFTAPAMVYAQDPVLVDVTITPGYEGIPAIGQTAQFTAWAIYDVGAPVNVTGTATWKTDDSSIATIGVNTGLAIGVETGGTGISATYEGVTGYAFVNVRKPWIGLEIVGLPGEDVSIGLNAYGCSGLAYEYVLKKDGSVYDTDPGTIPPGDPWYKNYYYSPVSEGSYEATFSVGGVVQDTANFSVWEHEAWMDVSPGYSGEETKITLNAENSDGAALYFRIERHIPSDGGYYIETVDEFKSNVVGDTWSYPITYVLEKGSYAAGFALNGRWEAWQEFSVVDRGVPQPPVVEKAAPKAEAAPVETPWVRTMPMTCWQVWVNEDNKFEMVFWYPYRDNNWVKIYDMSGKEVYSIDMPCDNPQFEVSLPNGMYTVKTFNDQPEPLQTFVIGK